MAPLSPHRKKKQRGATVFLEGALVLPTLLITILFVVEMGRMMLFQQLFTERARAGARNAAVTSFDTTSIKNYVLYNSATAPDGATSGFFGLQASMVSVTRLGTPGNWNDRIQVTISNYPMIDLIPLFKSNYTVPAVTATTPVGSLGAAN